MSELGPTLHDLHAEIGKTLLIWGWLEGEMIEAKIDWRRRLNADASSQSLKAFLQQLTQPREIRNAIAHGLASAHSNPWELDFEPYVTCRTPYGVRKISMGDLHRTQEQLESLRRMLRRLNLEA